MRFVVISLLLFTLVFSISFVSEIVRDWPFVFGPHSSAAARIIAAEPENHGTVYYSYSIDGRDYQGVDIGSEQRVGTVATIYYSDGKPWVSRIEEPSRGVFAAFVRSFAGALFLAVAGTSVIKLTGRQQSCESDRV